MLLECVPNVSVGRSPAILDALAAAITAAREVVLLDVHADPDHNRSVFTFAGTRAAVVESALSLVRRAVDLLDIHEHRGVHPRMGSVDVCPFVPLGKTPMAEAVAAARLLGERVAAELGIPVYLYGEAALRPERRSLPHVRRADFDALARAIATDPDRAPDHGPKQLHPRFGAIAIGARAPLVAYNIDLATGDLAFARKIAARLRESSGGLPAVRALGFPLESRGETQVSCNLTEAERTPPSTVFEETKRLAAAESVAISRSELVGLMPRGAVYRSLAESLALESFGARNVLDDRLAECLPLASYVERVADPAGGIGGGAIAADVGALATGLLAFVEGIVTKGAPPPPSAFKDLAARFLFLSRLDGEAFGEFAAARKLPPGAERDAAIAAALRRACEVPLEVMEATEAALTLARGLSVRGSIAVDLRIAARLLATAASSARDTLETNMQAKAAAAFRTEFAARAAALARAVEESARALAE